MPEGDMPIIEACQWETHAAIQCAIVPACSVPNRGRGIGSLLLITLFGCAMFGLGGTFVAWRQGMAPLMFARYVAGNHTAAPAIEDDVTLPQAPSFPVSEPVPPSEESAPSEVSSLPQSFVNDVAPSDSASLSSASENPQPEEVTLPPSEESAPPTSSSSPDSTSSATVIEEVSPEEVPVLAEESSSESSVTFQDSSQPSSSSDSGAVTGENSPAETGSVLPAEPPAPVIPNEIGVFLTEHSVGRKDFLIETLDHLRSMTGAALVFTVKGGHVFFDTGSPMAKDLELVDVTFNLPAVIRFAHARGIKTIARFIALKDPDLARALPATQIRHPKTKRSVGADWVTPDDPSVLAYNAQILLDLVRAGIDEVNLDYIRYPTEYLQSSIGLTGSEKADRIEAFLRMARSVIDQNGGTTKLGISTYAILGWNYPVNVEPIGQDVVRFAPLVDVISPMAYPATFAEGAYYNPAIHPRSRMYYLVYRTLTGYRDLLGEQAWKVRPWIQGYGITAKNLRDEIDAVFDAGACGFTVWNADNAYGLLYKELPTVVRPERCGE